EHLAERVGDPIADGNHGIGDGDKLVLQPVVKWTQALPVEPGLHLRRFDAAIVIVRIVNDACRRGRRDRSDRSVGFGGMQVIEIGSRQQPPETWAMPVPIVEAEAGVEKRLSASAATAVSQTPDGVAEATRPERRTRMPRRIRPAARTDLQRSAAPK